MCSRKTAVKASQGLLLIVAATTALGASQSAGNPSREQVIKIVVQIQRADYEGNRSELKRLNQELAAFVEVKEIAARVQ